MEDPLAVFKVESLSIRAALYFTLLQTSISEADFFIRDKVFLGLPDIFFSNRYSAVFIRLLPPGHAAIRIESLDEALKGSLIRSFGVIRYAHYLDDEGTT